MRILEELKFKTIAVYFVFIPIIAISTSCMNVRSTESIYETMISKDQFMNKTIAVLPVKEQASLSTDSLLSLKVAINEKLDDKIKEKLPNSKIINSKTTVNMLNDAGKLGILDDLIKIYESTGVFDNKMLDSLFSVLKSDYIIFSRLKAEKMAVAIVGKGFGASLDVLIINRKQKDITWGGTGEFKRGGVFGMGTTQNKEAAEELIQLAFQKF